MIGCSLVSEAFIVLSVLKTLIVDYMKKEDMLEMIEFDTGIILLTSYPTIYMHNFTFGLE